MSDDRAAIEAALKLYFDGLYEGNVDKLAASFHETSALTHEHGGKLTVIPREQWFEMVRGRPSPQAQGLARGDEIVLIDQSSPTAAFAKVKCQIPPRFFTDYLSLLKIDGTWKVAQKVFSTRVEEAAAS